MRVVAGQRLVGDADARGDATQGGTGEGVEHFVRIVRVPRRELVARRQLGELAGLDAHAGGAVRLGAIGNAVVAFRVLEESDF